MKVTYIYHSCYVVELEDVIFVFDYFKGDLPELNQNKKIFFFVSHKHQDHFALEIFQFANKYSNITFVLPKDIKFTDKYLVRHNIDPIIKEKILYVGKNTVSTVEIEKDIVKIETFRSTDEGVAFLITHNGKVIYHAGDLNWWSWSGLHEQENEDMRKRYTYEINLLSQRKIDLAFVVLDPRQEERYWWGMDYFLKHTDAKVVFPMHCWEKYWIIKQFKNERAAEGYCDRVMDIEREGMSFELS